MSVDYRCSCCTELVQELVVVAAAVLGCVGQVPLNSSHQIDHVSREVEHFGYSEITSPHSLIYKGSSS